ncbi:MAG TPA: NTP transferase domain-containing protein [Bacteroidales bacterium]|nr:NTP transferase domain-containing protein [Bacteroidales bacterium]
MSSVKSVVISCAGIGSRLGLGQTKALITLNGRSLIRWQLELLKDFEDIRIVVGYQANDVIKEVLKIRKDVIFVYNHDYFNTKTGASFYLGAKDANEFVIEWDGDLLVHPDDISKILNANDEFIGYSDIVSDEAVFVKTNNKGDVLSFSREHGDYEWTGPACIRKSKLQFTRGNVFEQLEPYLPMKGLRVRAYDIDTYDDYKRVELVIKEWRNL